MNKKKAHEFNIKGQQYYIGPIKQNQMKDNTVFIDSYHQILSKKIHTSRYTLPTNDEIVLDEWAMKNQLRFRSLISVNEIKLMGILKIYEKMTWGAIKQKY